MNKKKVLAATGLLLFFSVIGTGFYLSHRAERKLQTTLEKFGNYTSLDLDIFQRQLSIHGFRSEKGAAQIQLDEIQLNGIDLSAWFFEDKVIIDEVLLIAPEIMVSSNDSSEKESGNWNLKKIKKPIRINHLRVQDGLFSRAATSENISMFFAFPRMHIREIKLDSSTVGSPVPFGYKSYNFLSDSIRLDIDPQHFVAADKLEAKDGQVKIKHFVVKPYLKKEDFDKVIPYEKDRISLSIDSVQFTDLQFSFKKDSLYLHNPLMTVSGGDLEIYRNKLLPDDPEKSFLYSKLLREAPFKMDFQRVVLDKSNIKYVEKTKAHTPVARVSFSEISGEITNLQNTNLHISDYPLTQVEASANFQDVVPIKMNWSFHVNDRSDQFHISGNFGKIPASALHPILRAREMTAEGEIENAVFDLTGHDDLISGKVILNYHKFKIAFLKDDGSKSNFLSSIVNLFVDNDGSDGKTVAQVSVSRDQNRSFWNFVWKALQKGVKEIFSQI